MRISTILSWEYYGERCAEYLFGSKAIMPYRIIWIPFICDWSYRQAGYDMGYRRYA
ncbi:MAG: alanine:cation symporter family protein [Clostridia bacterium]